MVLSLKMGCKDGKKGEKNQFHLKSSENEEFGVSGREPGPPPQSLSIATKFWD